MKKLALSLCFLFLASVSHAFYSVVTSTDNVLGQTFLGDISNQFLLGVSTNPFVSNTYQVNLLGLNPNYVAPGQVVPSLPSQLDQDLASLVAVGTNTYVYGFANGMDTERYADVNLLYGLQAAEFSSTTCGGLSISSFPYIVQGPGPTVFVSSASSKSTVSSSVRVSTTTVINSSMTVISSTVTVTNTTTITNSYNWQPPTSVLWLALPSSVEGACLNTYIVAASTINLRWGTVFPSTAPVPGGP